MAEESDKKVFEFYQYFPAETRMMIVDKMDPSDRCRFTACSKLSKKEGKSSSNYLYGLTIRKNSRETSTVNSFAAFNFMLLGYIMKFHKTGSEEKWEDVANYPISAALYRLRQKDIEAGNIVITQKPNTNYMTCESTSATTLWDTELDDSVDVTQTRIQYFKDMLQKYQRSIKMLYIKELSNDIDFSEFESFPKLEELKVSEEYDVEKVIDKIRRPLKNLDVEREKNCRFLKNCELIYDVKYSLDAYCLELNNEQFSKLTALNVSIAIGQITEIYIFNIIKSWQNGTWKPMKRYFWDLQKSDFDVQKLLRLLDIKDKEIEHDDFSTVIINHNKEPERFAKFFFDGDDEFE